MGLLAGVGVACFVLGTPAISRAADEGAQAPSPKAGPLVVERIKDGFVVAPDVKVTEIAGGTAALVGGYAGWVFQEALLFGGGVYYMPNGPNGTDLVYGGMVVGFTAQPLPKVAFGVRALAGIGDGSVNVDVTSLVKPSPRGVSGGFPGSTQSLSTTVRRYEFEETFFVFEPQAEAIIRLSRRVGLSFGVGYRLTNASDYMDDQMRGVTGSVAIRFGAAP